MQFLKTKNPNTLENQPVCRAGKINIGEIGAALTPGLSSRLGMGHNAGTVSDEVSRENESGYAASCIIACA